MSEAREVNGSQKKAPMREVLAEAAFQLYLERGFERTTVDDIVARAGVGRRSFFRYFPSKEDAVFPDHESCLADMTAFLDTASDERDAVEAVCDAARLVLRMYAANPEFSVQRYRLTREVPGLRTYELSVVRRYERTLAGYLRQRWSGATDGALRAEVVAASVVAAHNNALRAWLRSGGDGDAEAAVDHALGLVRQVWGGAAQAPPAVAPDDVVVMVAPKGAPMWRVIQQVETALRDD
ncbi:TetR family transcriptional regulator [Streptomyces sp. SID8379]|uniref:TetR family transcriptional regulator n=1 Tax=unclassified Streptomyces TaxID=2593676 RepID=UPI0003707DF0|nr:MULTISPECIES: TetR family transcriptional regulator [unclassified Streptomyces]MYW66863.1 TetR family transcriptional regulator [Streptomyces sp. SID8379]